MFDKIAIIILVKVSGASYSSVLTEIVAITLDIKKGDVLNKKNSLQNRIRKLNEGRYIR